MMAVKGGGGLVDASAPDQQDDGAQNRGRHQGSSAKEQAGLNVGRAVLRWRWR